MSAAAKVRAAGQVDDRRIELEAALIRWMQSLPQQVTHEHEGDHRSASDSHAGCHRTGIGRGCAGCHARRSPAGCPWKVRIYELAHSKFLHPAWGWQHSERNYLLAMRLARADGLHVDEDVLFAASFLHDMSAFMPCKDPKMEHGDCAAQQAPAMLRDTGFPMRKLTAVEAAERGHMFYSNPGSDPTAIVLHDADSLDFLGDIGAARLIALTGANAASFAPAVKALRGFVAQIRRGSSPKPRAESAPGARRSSARSSTGCRPNLSAAAQCNNEQYRLAVLDRSGRHLHGYRRPGARRQPAYSEAVVREP